jgi:hypothetical protein
MDVMSIIEKYLRDNNFDGLCNDDCGCDVDDLAPCGGLVVDCKPAKKRVLGEGEYLGHCGPGDVWYEEAKDTAST